MNTYPSGARCRFGVDAQTAFCTAAGNYVGANARASLGLDVDKARASPSSDVGNGRTSLCSDVGKARASLGSEIGTARARLGADVGKARASLGSEVRPARTSLCSDVGEDRALLGSETGTARARLGAGIGSARAPFGPRVRAAFRVTRCVTPRVRCLGRVLARDHIPITRVTLAAGRGAHTSVTTGRIIGLRRVRSYTNEFSVSRTLPTR